MLAYFPEFYHDELLFSTFARYHKRMGNVPLNDTLRELFGKKTSIPIVEFPTRLRYFVRNLPQNIGITPDDLIQRNSLYPLYAPFLPRKRKELIWGAMVEGDGQGIKAQIGFLAGSLVKKDGLFYCPLCAKEDADEHGEAYFHRVHQVQGVSVCPIHRCYLKEYPIQRQSLSRLTFIFCNLDELCFEPRFVCGEEENRLIEVINGLKFLLDTDLKDFDQDIVHEKYMFLLEKWGFLTVNGSIKQKKLCDALKEFYSDNLLNKLESNFDPKNEYNWVKVMTRKPSRVVHPIRHILFIIFLGETVQSFFNGSNNDVSKEEAFPCLNYVADHYKQPVITRYEVTPDYKTREAVGTFTCDCGFIYSRKMNDAIFNVGTIKNFGDVWEEKLKEVITVQGGSLRAVARMMGADPGTIKKYAKKLGINPSWTCNSNPKQVQDNKQKVNELDRKTIYVDKVKRYVGGNPNLSRTQVRKQLYKEYAWLYRHDKMLLESILPRPIRNVGTGNSRIDWEIRDIELSFRVVAAASNLFALNKPTRVSKTRIGRELGIQSSIEKNLGKLPKTRVVLDMVTEDVEEFQIRRALYFTDRHTLVGNLLSEWQLYRTAGIRKGYSRKVDNFIASISAITK